MLTGHNCVENFNAFLKFGVSIRDERVLICHELSIDRGTVEGSNAIRARPILQDVNEGPPRIVVAGRLSHDDPREIFSSFGALSFSSGCVTLRNSEQAPRRFCREFE